MAQPVRKKKKRSAFFAPLCFLVIAAALVFGLSVFFRISEIEVNGNSLYSYEEVVEASGVEEGDNLFFVNRFAAVSRIYSKLPYVENAVVTLKMPNHMEIAISESSAVAYVTAKDGMWAIDRGCKLLSRLGDDEASGLLRIEGVTPVGAEIGETMELDEKASSKVSYLSDLLREITEIGLEDSITYINMTDAENPYFDYIGRFVVKFGTDENIEYKFQCLLSAVDTLAEGDRGTLDLSIDERVHLTYD